MTQRWAALDGLRGLAILLVVVAHARLLLVETGGMIGVTLFFVLSGFLITHLLIKEKEQRGGIDLKAFYARRALRLFPALAVYLLAISLVTWARRLDVATWESAWPPALYVANYAQIMGMDLFAHRHTWSLAVEEHFYLVWPVLVVLGATKRLRLLAGTVGFLMIWRLVIGLVDQDWAYMGTDTNAYALGLGCLLAAWRNEHPIKAVSPRVALYSSAGLVVLALVPHSDPDQLYVMSAWLPVVAALVSCCAVVGALEGAPGFLSARWLRGLGAVSYAFYLWHAPLLLFPGLGESILRRLLAISIALGAAALSWAVVERPILRSSFRRRFNPQVPLPGLAGVSEDFTPTHVRSRV